MRGHADLMMTHAARAPFDPVQQVLRAGDEYAKVHGLQSTTRLNVKRFSEQMRTRARVATCTSPSPSASPSPEVCRGVGAAGFATAHDLRV